MVDYQLVVAIQHAQQGSSHVMDKWKLLPFVITTTLCRLDMLMVEDLYIGPRVR